MGGVHSETCSDGETLILNTILVFGVISAHLHLNSVYCRVRKDSQ
jgi:hypothetical protein